MKLLSDLNWDTGKSRKDTAKLVLYYKIMNASAPAYLTNLLPEPNIPDMRGITLDVVIEPNILKQDSKCIMYMNCHYFRPR